MPIKTNLTYIITFLCLVFFGMEAFAQSTRIEFGEDSVGSVGKYDRIYQMVSEQKVDVNALIKFDAVQWGQIQPSIAIEQRIWQDFTLEPSLTMTALSWSRDGGLDFALNPNLDFKYYFNRARRERLGRNVLGFSADYLLVGFSYTLTDDKVFFDNQLGKKHIIDEGEVIALTDERYSFTSWRLMYGVQRRIGNMAYADFAFGGERHDFRVYGKGKILPTFKIKLGFALSREQFKRLSR